CDDRVSVRNRLKQGVEGSIAEMSTPPSKNCCGPRTWPALELSTQGVVTLHVSLVMAQASSGAVVAEQSPPTALPLLRATRLPGLVDEQTAGAAVVQDHLNATTLAEKGLLPPPVSATANNRSPLTWLPEKLVFPVPAVQPTFESWRSQMPWLWS